MLFGGDRVVGDCKREERGFCSDESEWEQVTSNPLSRFLQPPGLSFQTKLVLQGLGKNHEVEEETAVFHFPARGKLSIHSHLPQPVHTVAADLDELNECIHHK